MGFNISLFEWFESQIFIKPFKPSKRFQEFDGCAGNGCNNKQKYHHTNRAILIGVVDCRLKNMPSREMACEKLSASSYGGGSLRNSLTLSDLSAHGLATEREVMSILHKRNQIIELNRLSMAERWSFDLTGKRIHLSVEGGCGGTTFGLHCAVDCIQSGGRVLWASPEMPNATRFSQLLHRSTLLNRADFMRLISSEQWIDVLMLLWKPSRVFHE